MMLIYLALQAAPLEEMKSSMQAVSVDEAVAMFDRVCFAKFPDAKAAMEIIADPTLELTKLPETASQAMQPGDAWISPKAQVTYVDAEWMPMDMGSPQCSVTVVLKGRNLHSEIAGAMAATLKLPDVKFGKDAASASTKWDVPQPNGDKWRMYLSTSRTPSGTEMRTVIMNLRGKKKK